MSEVLASYRGGKNDVFYGELIRWSVLVGSVGGLIAAALGALVGDALAGEAAALGLAIAAGLVFGLATVAFRWRQLLPRFPERSILVRPDGIEVDGQHTRWADSDSLFLGILPDGAAFAFDFRLFRDGEELVRVGGWHQGGIRATEDGVFVAAGAPVVRPESLLGTLMIAESAYTAQLETRDEIHAPAPDGAVRLSAHRVQLDAGDLQLDFRPTRGRVENGALVLTDDAETVTIFRHQISNWRALVEAATRWFDIETGPTPDVVIADVDALVAPLA